jgi:hypothetical protein
MQIALKQKEIEAAIKGFISKQGISLNGKEIKMVFTSGRKDNGISVEIDIEDDGTVKAEEPEETMPAEAEKKNTDSIPKESVAEAVIAFCSDAGIPVPAAVAEPAVKDPADFVPMIKPMYKSEPEAVKPVTKKPFSAFALNTEIVEKEEAAVEELTGVAKEPARKLFGT